MSLSEQDQQELAQKLASMKYRRARKKIRQLDPKANLKIWRNGVGFNELHTTYELPTFNIRVTLVEKAVIRQGGQNTKGIKKDYLYTEARVEPLSLIVHP